MTSNHKFPTNTTSLHGLRTISNISVVIYHALVFAAFSLDDPSTANTLTTGGIPAYILSFITTMGNVAVDIFLLLSGFLFRASISNVTPYTATKYTVFRYLRLAPAYLIISYALRYQGNPNCISSSEFFLLPLANLNQRCVVPGWSTSLDFLSHILLLPLLHYPIMLLAILILTPPLRAWTWIKLGKPVFPAPVTLVDFSSSEEEITFLSHNIGLPRGNFTMQDPVLIARRSMLASYTPLYFGLPYRIGAVVIGMLLYTVMYNKNAIYRTVRNFPTCSLVCMSTMWTFYHLVDYNIISHPWAMFIHQSVNRLLVTMATSVVIILTSSIHDKPSVHPISRFLRTVLSCKLFQCLHKFSYIVYLLHGPSAYVLVLIPPRLTRDRVTPIWVLVMGIKWYLCTIVIGLPVWGLEWVALRVRRWLLRMLSGSGNFTNVRKKIT